MFDEEETMDQKKTGILINHLKRQGFLRTGEIMALGISRVDLGILSRQGTVLRIARGLYSLADFEPSEHHRLAEVAKQVPNGIVCLLSALDFHGLTTQVPHEVWMMIDGKARRPRIPGSSVRFFRSSGKALKGGIEIHRVYGIGVRVYSAAKTVADCFKYRSKVGLDVAMEALREGWKQRRFSMDELWSCATVCRVNKIMRPYLESLTVL
jgi:predicted transcriptional regulator of viral defense system